MKAPVDKSYQLLAARYIRRQIKQLTGQIEGIQKAEDIESVHRARVASRRLRQALAVFADCFAEDRVAFWRKETRRLGRGLGAARDKDVQIQWVSDFLARLEEQSCVLGVARVLVRCQRKRERRQPEVLRQLRQLLDGHALHEMLKATKKLTSAADGKQITETSPLVFERAEWQITERVKSLRAFEPCLASPGDLQQHHAMRIAAKRLRYTMELFKPIYDGGLDRVIEAIKHVQSLLGDAHDCDVWVAQLDKMLQKQAKRFVRFYRHPGPLVQFQVGIDYLKEDRRHRRESLFSTLVEFWREQTEAGLWDELAEILRARGPTPRAQEPTPEPAVRAGKTTKDHNGNGNAAGVKHAGGLSDGVREMAESTR
jgi:CHAD domain-containing protein